LGEWLLSRVQTLGVAALFLRQFGEVPTAAPHAFGTGRHWISRGLPFDGLLAAARLCAAVSETLQTFPDLHLGTEFARKIVAAAD
jgi:hypothetical protein